LIWKYEYYATLLDIPGLGGGVGEQDKKLTLSTNYTKTVIVLWDRRTNMGNRGVASSTTRFVCFSETTT